jgi:hypothetical protein
MRTLTNLESTPMLTPPELARRWRVKPEKIVGFIRAGLLKAADLSSPGSSRPRYRIDAASIAAFEAARSASPPSKGVRRKRMKASTVTEFF